MTRHLWSNPLLTKWLGVQNLPGLHALCVKLWSAPLPLPPLLTHTHTWLHVHPSPYLAAAADCPHVCTFAHTPACVTVLLTLSELVHTLTFSSLSPVEALTLHTLPHTSTLPHTHMYTLHHHTLTLYTHTHKTSVGLECLVYCSCKPT